MSDSADFGTYNDLDDEPVVSSSLEERINADLAARKRRTVSVIHPDVPKWEAVYRLPADRLELTPFYQRAEKAEKRKAIYHFDAAVLAAFNESLTYMGEKLLNGNMNLTFRDTDVMNLLGKAINPSEAVRALYGSDGIVSAVASQLMNEAGYGTSDEVQIEQMGESDPF
jgi:hypothetical protein